ncbi:MAG: GIY-YIG nuclease family protein [Patescibacteria group bacterium]
MFYYVYVLKSEKDHQLYVGKTKDLRKRFKEHNDGRVLATKGRRPFVLVYYEAFSNTTDCSREELYLKSGIGRESLKHRLSNLDIINDNWRGARVVERASLEN